MTIGVDFVILEVSHNNKTFQFLVYDLGGQKRFQFLHDSYIKGAKASIILYAFTRTKPFNSIPKWIALLMAENPHIPILICGSKKDLVQYEDIQVFEDKWFEFASRIPKNCNM